MSDENNSKVLDLDQILGQRNKIVVRRKDVEYSMRDMNALSANEVIRLQTMRQKVARLQMLEEPTDEQAIEIEKLFDRLLGLLCAEMPLGEISYSEKTTILAFYFTESQQKKAVSPKTT